MSDSEKNLDYEKTASVTDVHASVKREKEDPQTGLEPATIKVFAVCAIFMMIGGAYFGAHGGFNGSSLLPGYTPKAPGDEGEGAPKLTEFEQWHEDGKNAYAICANCHQADGNGQAGKYPPLAGSEWVNEGTERLALLVLHGLQGPISVKGQTYGAGGEAMPPHKSSMTPKKVAQVLTYIRSAWGNPATDIVTTEMIESALASSSDRTEAYTAGELPGAASNLPGEQPAWASGETAEGEAAEEPAEEESAK